MKITGTIRRWVSNKGWGTAHVYTPGSAEPERYFVHVSKFLSKDMVLAVGTRIAFLVGPPRTAGEYPVALEIELAPALPWEQRSSTTLANGGVN